MAKKAKISGQKADSVYESDVPGNNQEKREKIDKKGDGYALWIVSLLILFVSIIYCIYKASMKSPLPGQSKRQPESSHKNDQRSPSIEWLQDNDFYDMTVKAFNEDSNSDLCDWPIITEDELRKSPMTYSSLPFILRGAMNSWPANDNWKRETLLKLYGKRSASTGSESSIVYGGGAAGVVMSLAGILQSIRNESLQNASNLFTFDVSILKSVPEMTRDFVVPKPFRSWDNGEAEKQGYSWHMLSLGPTKSGLPFHIHSLTWIGVVHGAKRWFVYPPGASPPKSTGLEVNSLQTVREWFYKIYPSLKGLKKPALAPSISQSPDEEGYRPLECVQQAGDIVYLPKAWPHMTMNIGETIGIGGQAVYPAAERYDVAMNILEQSPNDLQALKAAALGMAHFAVEEGDRIKIGNKFRQTDSGVIELNPNIFDGIVSKTNDTWIVFYAYLKDNSRETEYLMKTASLLAKSLSDEKIFINIGIYDLKIHRQVSELHDLPEQCKPREAVDDPNNILPCIRLYPGSPGFSLCDTILQSKHTYHPLGESSQGKKYSSMREDVIFKTAVTYGGPILLEMLADYIRLAMTECRLTPGNIHTVTVKSKAWLNKSIEYVKMALELEPYNSELHTIHGEFLGYNDEKEMMIEALTTAEKVFDALIAKEFAPLPTHIVRPIQSIASVYQKFGHTYLTKEMADYAVPLLEKSLQYEPKYSPALISLIIAYNMLNDLDKAQYYLSELEKYEPRNNAVRELKYMMSKNIPKTVPKTKPKTSADEKKPNPKHEHPTYSSRKKPRPKPVAIKLHEAEDDIEL